jgi:amino acid efflux transporter
MFATTCPCLWSIMLRVESARSPRLGTASGAALYVGAVLGPGVLLLPALAAQAAGPASVVAWVGLLAASLAIAATFAALGVRHPVAGGAAAYVREAYGRVPAAVTGWWFYAGVLGGAPAVWLIGGFYVAHLTGGGRAVAVAAAAAMMVVVLGANARGLHATARMQLGLAALLALLLLVAVASALPSAHAANWTPFAPHGWLAVGTAANLLMLSFVGWEAVAHLAGDFVDPRRQLPRAMLVAFAIVAVLYVGLAVTTVAVLGGAQGSTVPLADLMQRGLGGAASALTAGAAVLLTVGTTNAYVAGATRLAGSLVQEGSMPRWMARPYAPLAVIAAAGAAILGLLAAGLVEVDPIVRAISACFVAVYVAATAAGVRLLDGRLRCAAALSLALVVAVLAFSGPYVAAPAAVALLAGAFVSVRAGGAVWRGGSGEPDCRTAWRAGGATPAPANAGSGGSARRQPRSP